ncbi:polysaccharide pyruvyl transferase family protein [Bifidobacterium felsineum]|uniref:Polysaccharide pyruvyl transferase domain-containing protein n=1 Tax=Bifidobacterium felsineum TaxID=2045440 RepID=A0A2M9HIC2_9BIFI|nr:polysaccharide pyruvyl transferase family protein [Bifidobacterium felsineum]MBT1165148.1 polysaccharide pyruvyl transferase family protein [Bifidobacterium felsineum]PJM76566.1 hypothetical protein CSQ86_08760 [Bifidobacterium felsineum]
MKYGLFSYETENIGDEIQSIAARRFLPRVDSYVDRDYVGQWEPKDDIKIIMNGWYMHSPYAWPPKTSSIDPLLISMYIDQADQRVGDAFFSSESIAYLNSHGPVGARDLSTLDYLQKHGIDSYFSGCMTLTLQADPQVKKQDFVLAVDLPKPVVAMLRKKTNRPVIESSPYFDANMSRDDRFQLAEYFLFLYQSAHAVVTTRLHAMLPSLALGTPVFLIMDHLKYDPRRYAGLDNLVNKATDVDYLNNYELFNVDNPPANPDEYLSLREKLIANASAFTGFNNDITFRTVDFSNIATNTAYVRLFTRGFHSLNEALLLAGDKAWLREKYADLQTRYADLQARYDILQQRDANESSMLRAQIDAIYQSRTWKAGRMVSAPIRFARKIIGK